MDTIEIKTDAVTISLVVPCYNEETAAPLFYASACRVLDPLAENGLAVEFVFVDDGSKDRTAEVLREIAEKDKRICCIVFSRNFGKEAAILAGLRKARGQYVVTMDADGQDPPLLIPAMLDSVRDGGYDCAGARRVTRKGEPPIRSFFARLFYRLMAKLTDIEVVDGARDFRLMNRRYIDAALSLPERGRFSKGIFPWVGFKTKWFEYENVQRFAGTTKWSFWKLFLYSLDGITAFSMKPLALASVCGIFLAFFSIVFISFIIARKLFFGDPVEGWASTVCIVLLCAGLQLFTVGVLGQYIAKIYTEVKLRPHFIVKEEFGIASCAGHNTLSSGAFIDAGKAVASHDEGHNNRDTPPPPHRQYYLYTGERYRRDAA
jgi:glycosyltransferase involved in cell wall biosynthesis